MDEHTPLVEIVCANDDLICFLIVHDSPLFHQSKTSLIKILCMEPLYMIARPPRN